MQKHVVSTQLSFRVQILLSVLMIVWMAGCSKAADPAISLEGDNASRVSYLFYNQAGPMHNLTLYFHTTYDGKNVEKVELLQDETVVSNSAITVNTSNNNGRFSMMLTLPYYIEQFDAVRLLNDRGEVLNTLRTGQYYFDPIDISAPSGESTWQLSNYKGKEIVNAATLDAVFTKSGDESFEYEIVLPSRLAQQQIVQQTDEATVKDNTLKYHYEGRIAPEDFQNYEAITYDMIVIQKDKQGRAVSLVSNNVQLDKG